MEMNLGGYIEIPKDFSDLSERFSKMCIKVKSDPKLINFGDIYPLFMINFTW